MKSDMHSVMLDHIAEEPGLILGLLEHRQAVTADFCRIFLENNIKRVYFSGSGSPANACEVLRYFCERILKIEASCIVPTVFNRHLDFNLRVGDRRRYCSSAPPRVGALRAPSLPLHTQPRGWGYTLPAAPLTPPAYSAASAMWLSKKPRGRK